MVAYNGIIVLGALYGGLQRYYFLGALNGDLQRYYFSRSTQWWPTTVLLI